MHNYKYKAVLSLVPCTRHEVIFVQVQVQVQVQYYYATSMLLSATTRTKESQDPSQSFDLRWWHDDSNDNATLGICTTQVQY